MTRRLTTVLILAVPFALSRLFFWLMGVRYDASPLGRFWQYLDIGILQQRLLPGLLHLHSQPPAFNLFLGLVLKLCPVSTALCFQIVYALLGFLLYCLLYFFLRLSRFSRPMAFLCAILFAVSPSSILYENWLFYSYPVAVLLALAAVALHRFQDTRRTIYAGVFLLSIAVVCLTWSAFHLAFLLGCVFLVLIPQGAQRRRVGLCACAAVFMVATLYAKNLAVFGFFGASSWTGMNLSRIASHSIGPDEVAQLVKSGRIPEIANVRPFSPLDAYPETYRTLPPDHADAPELTVEKKASGMPNFNHLGYLSLSKEYQIASSYIICHYPRQYLSASFDSWLRYCRPSWDNALLKLNRAALSGYISALSSWRLHLWIDLRPFRRNLFGVDSRDVAYRSTGLYPLTSLLFLPSILVATCAGAVVRLSRLVRLGDTSGLAFMFIAATVLYIAVLGNAVEFGENNRFRAMTDPLIFLASIITGKDVYVCIARRWLKPWRNR